MRPAIVASVLGADYAALGREVSELTEAGVDAIQWDVMDGRFVPNLTFGADVIAACRSLTTLGFEAHLMIEDPGRWIDAYVAAGCEYVIIHAEADRHLHRSLTAIREAGAKAGLALNPSTSPGVVTQLVGELDMVVVMTVNPGFGGQSYLSSMEPKIAAVRAMIGGRPIALEVDGGIKAATIGPALQAGADRFISGSAILGHPGGKTAAVAELRAALDDSE